MVYNPKQGILLIPCEKTVVRGGSIRINLRLECDPSNDTYLSTTYTTGVDKNED